MSEALVKDIWVKGMHCDACEKTITRALNRIGVAVEDIRHTSERVEVRFDPGSIPFSRLQEAVAGVGYSASENPLELRSEALRSRFQRVRRAFFSDPAAYRLEKNILKSSAGTLIVVALLVYLVYFIFFWNTDSFLKDFGQYIIYLSISVVAIGAAIRHLRAHRTAVSCMTGMMIGMTIGMIAGLLLGVIIGATNGMFVGSVFGMAIGMGVGAWVGTCCGIMGIMEGMMAGLMGGIMGAMTAVMMFSDRLLIFIPIFVFACLLILTGLSYMVYKEHKHAQGEVRPYAFWPYTFINFAIVLLGIVMMVWGPKAAFLQ